MDAPRARRVWVGLLVLVSTVAVPLVVGRVVWSGPTLARARQAAERGDWAGTVANAVGVLRQTPGDADATRLQARGLAHLGRPAEALALAARLGGDRLEAEDLFLVGQGLLRDGRATLGWAALDAAAKLDPRHPGATEWLATRPRTGGAAGAPVDRLGAVADGPALAQLVVGLALLGHPASASASISAGAGAGGDGANRLLASVLRRERSALLKVRSSAAARNLLARVLLEDGRGREAREWLGSTADPEAQWLLSRAALVEGDPAGAKAALGRAGSFGVDQPLAPEPARYLGSKACAECHRDIYDTQQSGHHAATFAWGDGLRTVPLPTSAVLDPADPTVAHRFERDGSNVSVAATVGATTVRAVIDYALGSGHHGVTMLGREPDGRHRSLRLSYYSGGPAWDLTSGFDPTPTDPHGYIGEVLNEDSFRNCLNCHTTRFTAETDRQGAEVADHGIGCERCHGPGDNHVRAVETSFPQPAIARPKIATPAARLKLCAQCHASDGVIPPADPRFIRFQATTLPYSRCVSESGGKLDCVACHDPHRNVETNPAYYEARCLACHGGPTAPRPAADVRVEAVAAARCATNATTGCVACHMPKVDKIMPFMSFTDHQIRIHRPVAPPEAPRSHP